MGHELDSMPIGATVELLVTKDDYKATGNYTNCSSCLLATAAKRQFNAEYVNEGVVGIIIDNSDFTHKEFSFMSYEELNANKTPFSMTLKKRANV